MKFYKYQGTGNDFIMIDNRNTSFSEQQKKDKDFIEKLCHRRFGIGADGLILIENSTKADFEMVYFNSDGNLGSMCGNGGRCAVAFAYRLGVFEGKETTFMAFDGLHFAKVASVKDEITEVELQMSDISEVESNPNFTQNAYFLNTGSPHYVSFLESEKTQNGLENYAVVEEGKKIRYNDRFKKEGTNVNFVTKNANNSEKNSIFVRTYERGVEDETLSCGTGVTACALAYSLYDQNLNADLDKKTHSSHLVHVRTLGGNLKVCFDYSNKNSEHNFTNIFLIGAATAVFEGNL
jgi:diaminopimelate epimerase